MRIGVSHHFFGGSGKQDFSASITALGTQIDDMIGQLDDIHVMFNDQHRVAPLH